MEKIDFTCDECCNECFEAPDNINGKGQYCKGCIQKMFNEDMGIVEDAK